MRPMLLACTLLAAAPLALTSHAVAQDDGLVGEWNLDADACAQARVTYTADGKHQSLQRGENGWETLASGSYTRSGKTVTVNFEGQEQALEIVELDADTLVLRNPDPAQMEALGVERVEFVRCPPRD